MAFNPTVRKVLQISEEAAPPVHFPLVVGKAMLILTQQDVRRVEDVRTISYNRVTPDGQLIPITAPLASTGEHVFGNLHSTTPPPSPPLTFSTLQALMNPTAASRCNCPVHGEQPPRFMASIASQLEWDKRQQSSLPWPLTYSVATSTTGLCPKPIQSCRTCQTRKCVHCEIGTDPKDSTSKHDQGTGMSSHNIYKRSQSTPCCGNEVQYIRSNSPCQGAQHFNSQMEAQCWENQQQEMCLQNQREQLNFQSEEIRWPYTRHTMQRQPRNNQPENYSEQQQQQPDDQSIQHSKPRRTRRWHPKRPRAIAQRNPYYEPKGEPPQDQ